MGEIADRIARVRSEIAEEARTAGRKPEDILLVAAAKTKSADAVREAVAAGVDAIGENRVQEMLLKREQGAYEGTALHFIGHLQSNKVKNVVGVCGIIESVSSAELLRAVGKRAEILGIIQNILLEVNIGREPNKSGVYPENLTATLEIACEIKGISVLGLMAVPPVCEKKEEERVFFDAMYNLFIDMSGKKYDNSDMLYLSMGMSGSFRAAIRSGANVVRVGSAIFGAR